MYCAVYGNWDSVDGIATGYGVGVPVPVKSRIFFSPCLQTGSGVQPVSYVMNTSGSFPELKAARA
jgi:hypothetical protein